MNFTYKLSKGPAAANAYIYNGENFVAQLQLDWSYDSIDFKYLNNPWINISYNEIDSKLKEINHENLLIFKELSCYLMDNLKDYSEKSNQALKVLSKIKNK